MAKAMEDTTYLKLPPVDVLPELQGLVMCPPPFMASNANSNPNYNELLLQISTNLSNTLRTFGPSSPQYQTILQTLKECLQDIDSYNSQANMAASKVTAENQKSLELDPDMLSLAMGFLELGK